MKLMEPGYGAKKRVGKVVKKMAPVAGKAAEMIHKQKRAAIAKMRAGA